MGAESNATLAHNPSVESKPRAGEATVLWVLWLTYGSFYFCRINLAAAVPGMETELGYSKTQIGMILGGLKIAYGIGQLINGQLAEQFSARLLLAVGMLCSALLNVVFGLTTGLYFLIFVWACNGYCQALGWTPVMRVAANWIPLHRRGSAIGFLGTGYQLTQGLTFVISGLAAHGLGWRGALYVPAVLLTASAVVMLLFLRESPDDRQVQETAPRPVTASNSWQENVLLTLTNPSLWLLALTLGLLNACRYGYLDWGLTHLLEVQKGPQLMMAALAIAPDATFPGNIPWASWYLSFQTSKVWLAALNYAILPLGGIAGAYLTGWATDRFLGGRRAPAICAVLLLLGVLTLFYDWMARTSFVGTVLLLAVIGFAIYGPQVLLVGAAPADLARRGTAAAAVGFVDFMGYVGAYAGNLVTGIMVDAYGWQIAVSAWAGCALLGALTAALLWNATASNSQQTEDCSHKSVDSNQASGDIRDNQTENKT